MPAKITVKARLPKISVGGIRGDVNKIGEKLLIEATREWVKATVTKVPVYAGTARGTLQPLGRFVKARVPRGSVSKAREAKRGYTTIFGKRYDTGFNAGKSYGQDFELAQEAMKFTFTFTPELPYFIWNNYGRPLSTLKAAPWGAIEAGEEAWKKYVHDNFAERFHALVGTYITEVRT